MAARRESGEMLAVLAWDSANGVWKPHKVFGP
jgi:hypothetical protein